jgi:hypothetical protein
MKVDIRGDANPSALTLCEGTIAEINILKRILEGIEIDTELGKSTQQIQKQLNPLLAKNGWILDFTFDSNTISTAPSANYVLNAIKDLSIGSCGHRHRLLLELCFDNRQAIGTNLLKFEAAKRLFEKNENCLTTSIIICGSHDALAHMKWDGGVASHGEYENALLTVYRDILSITPQYLVIKPE